MCTEYRLSVTPGNIVVHDRNNTGHFLQQCALVCTNRYSYAELLHNKELMERMSKKGIALVNIASNVHLTARSAMPLPLNHMKQIEGVIIRNVKPTFFKDHLLSFSF
jgi:hypothetical protein